MSRRSRGVTLAALAALLVLVAAAPASADVRKRFLHFNVCGSKCEFGDNENPVYAIEQSIEDFHPHAVSLNEVCLSQVARLQSRIAGDWSMEYRFTQTNFGDNHCYQDMFGIAILSSANMWDKQVWGLPHAEGAEQRMLLCATTAYAKSTRVCTTHLSNDSADWRTDQTRFIAQETDWYVDFWPVVLMGDFNARPKDQAMNWIYTREHGRDWDGDDAHGRYREIDRGEGDFPPCRCGEWTWPFPDPEKKIDYVFLSNPHWHDLSGDVTNPGSLSNSDHRLVKGDALLRTSG